MSTTDLNVDNPSSAAETIDLEARLQAAQRAFASTDFEGTIAEIVDIPEDLRTPELSRLFDRANQFLEAAALRSAARESIKRGDFEQAISQIESIPELQRDREIQDLLKQAQRAIVSSAAVTAAEACLQEYRYADAVTALETIPPNARNTNVTALLGTASKKARMVQQILSDLEGKWESVREEPTVEKLQAVRELVLLHLELQPNDTDAQQRLSVIDGSEYYISCLKVVRKDVPEMIAAGKHIEAMQLLETIPEVLRSAEIQAMFDATAETVSEVQNIGQNIIATVSTIDAAKLLDPISRLEKLHTNPVELLRSGLFETEFDLIIRSAVRQSLSNPEMAPVFKQIVNGLKPGEFCDVLKELDPAQLAGNRDGEVIVADRIIQVLDQLDQFPIPEADRHVQSVNRFREILPESHERLLAWNRFFRAAATFRKLMKRKWTRREILIENLASEQLEEAAKELATAGATAFPVGNDWATPLLDYLGNPADCDVLPLRRAAKKIRLFQRRGRWPEWSLTRFTRQKVTKIAAGLFAVAALGLGGKILYSLIFGLGGLVGSILALFVVSLWLFFCVLLSRSM